MDVTAVLLTSIALAGATGVSGAPAHLATVASGPGSIPIEVVSAQASDRALTAAPIAADVRSGAATASSGARTGRLGLAGITTTIEQGLAPTRGLGATFGGVMSEPLDASLLPRLSGQALLDQIALLPTADVAEFVGDHPDAVSRLLLDPPSARSVASWWTLTTDDARDALLAGAPELVGNLDGLDTSLRDTANRTFLRDSIVAAEDELSSLGRAEKADAEQRLTMLQEIEESLITTADQPKRTLLSVDTAWPGRAAVVVGDLETADYVSYMVPGMFFTVTGQIVDWTVISQDLYDEQRQWVRSLGGADESLRGASTAVVSWIGYQTPGITDVVSLDLAEDGAKYISSSVKGLQQTRSDREPHLTLVTHSYGSTATLMALQRGAIDIDSLVIIGSPGSAARSVDEIGMDRDDVYVGEAAWDPVVDSAFFGSDPGSAEYGATEMSVDGGEDPVSGGALAAASGHLGYFDAGTEAMRNMALVGLDRGDLVTGVEGGSPGVQLAGGRR